MGWIALHALFISNTFKSNARLKLAKNQAKAKQNPEAELFQFDNYLFSSLMLLTKNNKRFSKKCILNKYVCLNELVWLMTMKMRLKIIIRSHRYDIKRPKLRHRDKYTKYKMENSISNPPNAQYHFHGFVKYVINSSSGIRRRINPSMFLLNYWT